MFNKNVPSISTINDREFIWVADYLDGSHLMEFDTKWNSFSKIDKANLIRFGYIGLGNQLYFASDGMFSINGMPIDFAYIIGEEVYDLTGLPYQYNDIIQYKEANVDFNMHEITQNGMQGKRSNITTYNFGYKINYTIKGIRFKFQVICTMPFNKPVYFTVRLVSDQNLEGQLGVKIGDHRESRVYAPLTANIAGELTYYLDGKG